MRKPDIENDWLVATFLLGAVLFNYPVLSLFNTTGGIWGVPALYAYLFVAWGALIALVAWIAERNQ